MTTDAGATISVVVAAVWLEDDMAVGCGRDEAGDVVFFTGQPRLAVLLTEELRASDDGLVWISVAADASRDVATTQRQAAWSKVRSVLLPRGD